MQDTYRIDSRNARESLGAGKGNRQTSSLHTSTEHTNSHFSRKTKGQREGKIRKSLDRNGIWWLWTAIKMGGRKCAACLVSPGVDKRQQRSEHHSKSVIHSLCLPDQSMLRYATSYTSAQHLFFFFFFVVIDTWHPLNPLPPSLPLFFHPHHPSL